MTDQILRAARRLLTVIPVIGAAAAASAQSADTSAASAPFRLAAALDAPDWLSISGTMRPRYETLSDPFVAGRSGTDALFSLKSTLAVELHGGDFTAGAELADSRRLGGDKTGGAASELDALEMIQAYVAWRPTDILQAGDKLDVTAGRFTMDVGSRRLIARPRFRNVFTQFDGIKTQWAGSDGVAVTAFLTSPVSFKPTDAASRLDNEVALNAQVDGTQFVGAHLKWRAIAGATAEVFAFDIDERDRPGQATRNRDYLTYGARLSRAEKAGAFDFDLEWAMQDGVSHATSSGADTTQLDHEARMGHAEGGYTFDTAWSPRVAVMYDFASGDESPLDGVNGRFDPLFGDRSFEFGPTSLYGAIARTNLSSPGLRLDVTPDAHWDAMIMVRKVDLAEARDSFGNSGVRDTTGQSGKHAGDQIEWRVRRTLIPNSVRLDVGGAVLVTGKFLDAAPNATGAGDAWYGYSELTWQF